VQEDQQQMRAAGAGAAAAAAALLLALVRRRVAAARLNRALRAACEAGDAGLVRALLARGADCEAASECAERWKPLVLAARAGSAESVDALLAAGARAQPREAQRHYALRAGALGGHAVVCLALLRAGADANQRSWGSRTPLHGAAMGAHAEVVALLLAHGADACVVNDHGETALDLAVRKSCEACVRLLSLPLEAQLERAVACLAADAVRRPGGVTWVAVSGPPGAGKSTISAMARRLLHERHGIAAQVVPMDGYHLPRAELDRMADPAAAHHWRGAPWTFDAAALVADLERCQRACSSGRAGPAAARRFPSWDHAVGDPGPRDIEVDPGLHRVVFVEGNYLLLVRGAEPWPRLAPMFDERWLVECPLDVAVERVTRRNAAAFGWTLERTRARVLDVDRVNMVDVLASNPRSVATRVLRNYASS
jgi:pantothenate kinase